MPTQGKDKRKRQQKYEWLGHIQVYFSDDERNHVLDYIGERQWDLEDTLCSLTQSQVSCKFTYDNGRDSYYLTLQPKEKNNPYYGYTIGVTHLELVRIVQIAAYVVNELLPNEGLPFPTDQKAIDW